MKFYKHVVVIIKSVIMMSEKKAHLLSKYGHGLYALICIAITCYLVWVTLIEYLKNEDTTLVDIKKFNDGPKDTYHTVPSLELFGS